MSCFAPGEQQDVAAATAFFRQAFGGHGRLLHKITFDGYQASHRAANEGSRRASEGSRCEILSSRRLK
jgi:hypothetical protein